MDYSLITATIERIVDGKVASKGTQIRLGVVESAGGTEAAVVIDGSSAAASAVRACACAAGDRVVVLRQGTQFYCIAKVGG